MSFRDQIIGTFRRVDFLLACSCLLFPRRLLDSFVCGLPFQIVGTDINFFSWWSDSEIRDPLLLVSIYCQVISFAQKFGPALLRPSPTTYPENNTNPCADLVEAESLVICEEITWRPLFFWCLVPVDCRPRSNNFYQ